MNTPVHVLVLALFLAHAAAAPATVTAGCTADGKYTVVLGVPFSPAYAAWAEFTDSLADVGWGTLHVLTNPLPGVTDSQILYCAGMVEGVLTHTRIWQHFSIYKNSTLSDLGSTNGEWPAGLVQYIGQNIEYTRAAAAAGDNLWWQEVASVLAHTEGMREGYRTGREADKGEKDVTEMDWWILQAAGDMDDIGLFVGRKLLSQEGFRVPERTKTAEWHDTHHHCTGMVMLRSDWSDLYFSQDAWQAFNFMNRILKSYDFSLHKTPSLGSRVWSFASHPGLSFSMDDFWILDSGLMVLETTMHTWNETLYDLYCTPKSVLCWIRVQVAARLAKDGKSWVENFVRENSGTYNNQYFVVDLNKFTEGKKPTSDLLWAVEQLPGTYEAGDRTKELVDNGYVPSINTPAFSRIYETAGYPQQVEQTQCNYWSYENCSRMQICKRDAQKVASYDQFKAFMRYNRWQTDPLSNGDPAQSILSRYDLRPDDCLHQGTMTMCPHAFGGTDSKTTNAARGRQLKFDAVGSPQYESQTPWQFGTERWKDVLYTGLPEVWKFPWYSFGPSSSRS
jgi:hypothetical protein